MMAREGGDGMIDWERAEAEFVTTDASYRQIAKPLGISYATVGRYAIAHDWLAKRAEYRKTVHEETVSIFPELAHKKAAENAAHLRKLYDSTDKMVQVLDQVFADADQFHRYVVRTPAGATEKRFEKMDTQAIKDITGALKDLVTVLRAIYDIPTAQERHNMEIATKRLQLEVERAKREADQQSEDKGGVIVRIEGKAEEYSV